MTSLHRPKITCIQVFYHFSFAIGFVECSSLLGIQELVDAVNFPLGGLREDVRVVLDLLNCSLKGAIVEHVHFLGGLKFIVFEDAFFFGFALVYCSARSILFVVGPYAFIDPEVVGEVVVS